MSEEHKTAAEPPLGAPLTERRGSNASSASGRPAPKTPRDTARHARFNFSAASARDGLVFGAEKPGFVHPNPALPVTPRGGLVGEETVDEWSEVMRAHGVRRVLCLLNDDELGFFGAPLLPALRRHFSAVTQVALTGKDAVAQLLAALLEAEAAAEPVVVHCSTGQGRTAVVLALWLQHRYKLSVDDAVAEVRAAAREGGAVRKPTAEGLLRLLLGRGGAPAGGRAASAAQTESLLRGPRSALAPAHGLHISFVQMGGTIDKDFPRAVQGYGFEISEPAVARVLKDIPCAFTHDVTTVCRKDSLDVTPEDRLMLLQILRKAKARRIVVTHGTDAMIETAQFVASGLGDAAAERTIVFTGANRPQRFSDSDAQFNVGAAITAVGLLDAGCYICMNGRTFASDRCRRDARTGQFVGSS
jgi:L-asparaginase